MILPRSSKVIAKSSKMVSFHTNVEHEFSCLVLELEYKPPPETIVP